MRERIRYDTDFLTASTGPVLYQRGTGVVLVSFCWLRVLDKAEYSAFESTLNSCIVSYRMTEKLSVFSLISHT